MGNSENPDSKLNAGFLEYIGQQYSRVRKDDTRDYLTLSEVLQIQPHQDYPFDFRHLSILYVCDSTLDGVFSLDDFQHFALWMQINLSWVQMYQFKSQLQARTVSKLITILETKDSHTQIIDWFIRMLLNDKPCGQRPNTHVRIEALKLVYEIFNVKMMTEMDIQSFFFLMKRASEDLGCPVHELREPGDEEEYEEYVDVAVCKQFLLCFLKGATKILKQIGYGNTPA